MKKILITSIEQELIDYPNKKIKIEIPANNALVIEIERNGEEANTNIYALLR